MKLMGSIFKTFLLSLLVIAQVHFAYAQTASILPPAKTTFVDQNGKPLTGGKVDFYIPGGTTRKTTWQDAAQTIPNANPVVLDAAGRALILGSGSYRQVVKDSLGNLIWDQVTSSAGSGGSSSTATGDGDLVGTIKPWAGMTAPNQYLFTYGQEISRATYATLLTAITSSQAAFCSTGSPVLSGLGDTTNFWIGSSVEISCVGSGFSTIVSKTSSTVTLAANANVTTNTTAVFYPWGRGNGTTTFNLPDLRGFAIAGNNNMGGVASSRLTTAFFGAADPNSSGAAGGGQSVSLTLLTANLPAYTPAGSVSSSVAIQAGIAQNPTASVPSMIPGGSTSVSSTFTGTAQGGTSTPIVTSVIQPTKTANYIIKVTPDANSATASGVTDLGGMTGSVSCGTGLTCTGNVITVNIGTGVTSVGGMSGVINCGAGITCAGNSISGGSNVLSPNFYLATTGLDTNNCLSSGTACLTLGRIASLINATGSTAPTTINVAAGSYTSGATFTAGNVSVVGAGSGVTTISDGVASATLQVRSPAQLGISGVRLQNTVFADVWALYGGVVNINTDVILGPAPSARLACQDQGATVYGNYPFTVDGGTSGSVFLLANCAMRFFGGPPVLTFTNSPVFTQVVDAINNSVFKSGGMQFKGAASVTYPYQMSQNSSVDQEQNATDWPGALQGALSGGAVFYNTGSSFTGSIAGTTLTVTGMVAGNGALGVGNQITGSGVPANTKITAFGTGTGLNGNYTINNSVTLAATAMTSKSIYPCVDSVGLCPVVAAAPSGLGVGGTATVSDDGFGGDYAGKVTLTVGSSGTAASGALFLILHSQMANCVASPSVTGTGILTSTATAVSTSGAFRWLEIAWTNAAALTASGSYNINYSCR